VAWAHVDDGLVSGKPVFDATYGHTVWEHFARHVDKGKLFAEAMSELTAIDAPTLAHSYPWNRFAKICDVAGGRGTLLAEILDRHASVRAVLFDEPYVLETAEAYLRRRGVGDRVERLAGSFFERIPGGCDAYILKDILHDWDDGRCTQILANVRATMTPDARLLVCELPIDHRHPEYPAPISDLQMLAITSGGRQRTTSEFASLFRVAGLELEKAHELPLPMAIFEARPR
jgi:hypothetical protein